MSYDLLKRIRVLDPPMSRSRMSMMTTNQASIVERSDTWYPSFYEPEVTRQRGVSVMWKPQLDVLAPDIIGSTPLDVSFYEHVLIKLKELRAYERAIFDAECWKRDIDPEEIFGKEDT